MMIGAAALVRGWGRPMEHYRNGVLMNTFLGRMAEIRPESQELENSIDQDNFRIIAVASDFKDEKPRKFDVIRYNCQDYTVQRGHLAGADEEELVKMTVRGGLV